MDLDPSLVRPTKPERPDKLSFTPNILNQNHTMDYISDTWYTTRMKTATSQKAWFLADNVYFRLLISSWEFQTSSTLLEIKGHKQRIINKHSQKWQIIEIAFIYENRFNIIVCIYIYIYRHIQTQRERERESIVFSYRGVRYSKAEASSWTCWLMYPVATAITSSNQEEFQLSDNWDLGKSPLWVGL